MTPEQADSRAPFIQMLLALVSAVLSPRSGEDLIIEAPMVRSYLTVVAMGKSFYGQCHF